MTTSKIFVEGKGTMQKLRLSVFTFALALSFIFTANCSWSNLTAVEGSGNSKSEQRDVKGFVNIEASSAVNVEIIGQKEFSVMVEADDNLLQNIKTEVSGDTLKIYSEGKISPKTNIKVIISMPEILTLNLSGASTAAAANIKSDLIVLKASGASKIKVSGEAIKLTLDASGASQVDAENLKAEDVQAQASGASGAIVSATEELSVDAGGASKILYVGEPKRIKQNASGASSVSKK